MRRSRQDGYALLIVLGALAVIAIVAGQFATSMDEARKQAAALQAEADGRVAASSALARALHWLVTQPGGPDGFGEGVQRTVADGRVYEVPGGARVAFQDQQALLSLNLGRREILSRFLEGLGASPGERDTLVDVLADYIDTDNLRRLNGAEATQYKEAGLRPPRNDWLLSVQELAQMPGWTDRMDWTRVVMRHASVRRSGFLNPNLMPIPLLRAALPGASTEQLVLFDTLRQGGPFSNGSSARLATGLPFGQDDFIFHTSDEIAVVVWSAGMPRALQFMVWVSSGDPGAPWTVTEVHAVDPPPPGHVALPFPTTPSQDRVARGF
jgi:hypothetical protein